MASDPDDKPVEGVPSPETSGSIDVAFSSARLPRSDGTPIVVGEVDSAPVASGKVVAAVTPPGGDSGPVKAIIGEPGTGRSGRIRQATQQAIGTGVSAIGTGVSAIGTEVSKLGEKSRKIPMVGSSVARLGEGISQVGESLHELPRMAGTRRGQLLMRSLFVGFVLVAAWISVIVALQLHGNETPDFRPVAEKLLVQLSTGGATLDEVYEKSSPRFQEMVRKERFIDDMNDLNATVGKFREITAINDTLVTSATNGRIGRVSLTVAYEKATCKASVSLHEDQGTWKLLGVGVELPPELRITQAQREERVQACKDPMAKSCDLHEVADKILQQLRDGKAADVWDAATPVFQKQEEKSRFVQIQAEHAAVLGDYRRIIAVTEAKVITGTIATYDVLTEYASSKGVRAVFGFYRGSKTTPWKLRSFKIVVPMPRADEDSPVSAPTPSIDAATPPAPLPPVTKPPPRSTRPSKPAPGAGSGSATRSAGSGSAAPVVTP